MVILVALFVDKEDLDTALKSIKDKFNVQGNKIFILNQVDEEDELILTFNIQLISDYKEDLNIDNIGKLIRIHRRKESLTLYTINALNYIGKESEINWNLYRYSFLTVSSNVLKIIKTKIKEVFDLTTI